MMLRSFDMMRRNCNRVLNYFWGRRQVGFVLRSRTRIAMVWTPSAPYHHEPVDFKIPAHKNIGDSEYEGKVLRTVVRGKSVT